MTNIRLLNLETPSSLSELSSEETDNVTGGLRLAARTVYFATRSRTAARSAGVAAYWYARGRGLSIRSATAASLNSAE